jgi:hypothetical protein
MFFVMVINSFCYRRINLCSVWLASFVELIVKAHGLGDTKRISESGAESQQSYERRMRVFNLEVIVIALIVLTILVLCLSATWMAFQKSLANTF